MPLSREAIILIYVGVMSRVLSRTLILTCLAVALARPDTSLGMQAGTRTVAGSVLLRGPALSAVRITIQSASLAFRRVAYADGSGTFSITGVPVGDNEIILEAEGFVTVRDQLIVPPGTGPFPVQFAMVPASRPKEPASKDQVSVPALRIPAEARKELEAGMRELHGKRTGEARKHFEQALKKHADFPQALHALALLDAGEQQSGRALERLRRAVQIDPAYAEGFVTLGRILNLEGNHTEALQAARKAVELQRNLWPGYYEMGVAALSLGQEETALEAGNHLEAIAGLKTPELRLLRSGIFLRKSRFEEARAELHAFLELAPAHPMADLARRTLQQINQKLPPPQ